MTNATFLFYISIIILIIFSFKNIYKPLKVLRNLKPPQIIMNKENGYYYLIEDNIYYHIPDEPTFEYLGRYFGFSWSDAKPMQSDEIKLKFKPGKDLPSIKDHFPKT